MNAIEAIQQRVSIGVLGDPAPSEEQVEALLAAAVRAPDHGVLRPWRFLILTGKQREQLGNIFVSALRQSNPDLSEQEAERAACRPLRAPMLMVAVAEVEEGHRIPVIDQILATGAAVQNIMVAAHAMGIGAMWRTGDMAQNVHVKEALGFAAKDEIVGFLYLGTPAGSIKRVPTLNPQDYVRELPSQ
ncbi:MAG TPA: nitroreductase [Alcanivoracaceae bacterium]|nr:nitroreductase [Alcanivoracaceae bacterium]